MAWKFPNSFRKTFKTSTSQLIFKTKFQEVKNLGQSKIIGLIITRTNVKQKPMIFACKG